MEVGNRGLWENMKNWKKKSKSNMKFGTLNWHKVGQIGSYRAVDKWIRCGILRSFIWEGSQVARKSSWWEKRGKTVWKKQNFKFLTCFCHQVGRIKVAGAFDRCIRCRILRSFICDGSRGLILSKNSVCCCFKKLSFFGIYWESKMEKKWNDERNGSGWL